MIDSLFAQIRNPFTFLVANALFNQDRLAKHAKALATHAPPQHHFLEEGTAHSYS